MITGTDYMHSDGLYPYQVQEVQQHLLGDHANCVQFCR